MQRDEGDFRIMSSSIRLNNLVGQSSPILLDNPIGNQNDPLVDADIVHQFIRGDQAAFVACYEPLRSYLTGFLANSKLFNYEEVEGEATHYVGVLYEKAVTGELAKFRGESKLTTYLTEIVLHDISAIRRKARWHREITLTSYAEDHGMTGDLEDFWDDMGRSDRPQQDHVRDAENYTITENFLESLEIALSTLTERQRIAYQLTDCGVAGADAAEIMGLTNRNTFYKALFDARFTLRLKLSEMGFGAEVLDDFFV